MHVAVLLYDGFDEMDAVGPFEVFANAARVGADCEVSLREVDDAAVVTASHGMRVEPDGPLPQLGGDDLLVVPGGGWNDRDRPGAWTEAERGAVPDSIAAMHDGGATVASVCTGGMLAARAGILDGRPAVTHASALDDLRQYATVVDARVVDDGDVVTAGGVTSGLDLAFHLVDREFGDEVARQVATEMEYQPTGDVVRP
ncbi:DJ-1/PfpI family protein [Haloglomus halophilum]|uniref:DJ-1/PfpI family protein n=1 Tax=Haloglomus halophilum TaxID=2962672 RepID=UPI0020CA1FA1|nr:DJ-1/PfpI family protein [Haloglomus halophilum]